MPIDVVPGTGVTAVPVATEPLPGGDHAQLIKLLGGAAGSVERIEGSEAFGLEVDVTRSALPAGAATQTTLAAALSALASILTELQGTLDVAGSVAVSNFPAAGPVSGTVSVDNFPATQPVSGTVAVSNQPAPLTDAQLRATAVPVSGPATDVQLRATALPVSGTVTANVGTGTQPVSGTFWQATQPVSGPATDTQLRATPLPVSGTVTANAGTGTRTTKEVRAATATLSSVTASATSVTALAANANRLGATVVNDSTAVCYLKLGATASLTSYTIALAGREAGKAGSYWEAPYGYVGVIDALHATATGDLRITEVSA